MDSALTQVRDAHSALANRYAEMVPDFFAKLAVDQSILTFFAHQVHQSKGTRDVLDAGCGPGYFAPILADLGLHPTGIDIADGMVSLAQKKYPEFSFATGDIRSLPYPDQHFNGCLSWYSLIYLPPTGRVEAISECVRVLAPGGIFACAVKAGEEQKHVGGRGYDTGTKFAYYTMSVEWLRASLLAAGMEVVMWAGRPAEPGEASDQAYFVARKSHTTE